MASRAYDSGSRHQRVAESDSSWLLSVCSLVRSLMRPKPMRASEPYRR